MTARLGAFAANNRKFIPLSATAILAFAAYGVGAFFYEGMREPQVFLNLFRTSPYLLISAVGMTFVILSGGIDLSVSGVVALTTVAAAALLRDKWNPWLVMLLMLAMGMALGAIMGAFITYLKVQPFIATLAGQWFARGMCFFISDDAIPISNRVYRILAETKLLIPGLANPVTQQGPFITILVVVAVLVLAVGVYVAHFTRFGRTVYAIGGNELSARLMGLPVNRTKVWVYALNGACSALAGLVLSVYVSSGHGLYAQTFEMTVIAAVVMGGTMLTGGVGYVTGTLFGVLITVVIQTLIQFNGSLSSWWTNIVVGALTLMFIGAQSLLAARPGGRLAGLRGMAAAAPRRAGPLGWLPTRVSRRQWALAASVVVVIVVLGAPVLIRAQNASRAALPGAGPTSADGCELQAFRQDQAAGLMRTGAVIAYERNGGANCVDELYGIYPDGRIVADNGLTTVEKQLSPDELAQLLTSIEARGWFTDAMYDTWHTPCGQCFGYFLTVYHKGQTKTVMAVDGGTDAPADYWQVVALINKVLPAFPPAP